MSASYLHSQSFSLPYGVAYPILQASLVVAGILGITCFGELRQKEAIVAFFAASALVVAGAVLLGLYGPSPFQGWMIVEQHPAEVHHSVNALRCDKP